MSRRTLPAALAYEKLGWSIVPARVDAKHALVSWKRWQQVRPTATQLRAWWLRWPTANIALVTGEVSGVVVVDIDPHHGGDDSLAKLERTYGDLPWLAVVVTPSGGWHVYLRHPGERVGNSAGLLGPGLDVRGDGGLALLPPSRRGQHAYRWQIGSPTTIPPAPGWLLEALQPPPRGGHADSRPVEGSQSEFLGVSGGRDAARLAGLLRLLDGAQEGSRNQLLYWCGLRLRELIDQGAPTSSAKVLAAAAEQRGLPADEVRATLRSALGEDLLS